MHTSFSFKKNGQVSESTEYGIDAVYFEANKYSGLHGGQKSSLKLEKSMNGINWNIISQQYDEPMSFTLQIINKDGSDIVPEQERALCKWLCAQGEFNWFFIHDKRYTNIWLRANFSNPQVWCVNNINGMQFTVTTDSPVAYSDELDVSFTVVNTLEPYRLFVYNDEDIPIYPEIEITAQESGDISIYNSYEPDRVLKINDLSIGETIKISLNNGVFKISSSKNRDIWNNCNLKWLRFYDDDNMLYFSKKCNVSMKYREYRRLIVF